MSNEADKHPDHATGVCCGACEFAAAVERDPSLAPIVTAPFMVANERSQLRLAGASRSVVVDKVFAQPRCSIGRVASNDLVVDDFSVSRRACEITTDPEGRVWITDLNSTCGTVVNGVKIFKPTQLRNGDAIDLGNVKLTATLL
ncbi:MAG TPA: FHA domain-containing protein [Kofleriaceae bacterium]|nr:FHA domain-containing protein [Kofleriaceae bacterium]